VQVVQVLSILYSGTPKAGGRYQISLMPLQRPSFPSEVTMKMFSDML